MLFRTNKGELLEIKKYDFANDKFYYQKIMSIQEILSTFKKTHNIYHHAFENKNNKQSNKQ
jgi:hypothetical protein